MAGTLGNKRSAAARTYNRRMAYTQHVRKTTPLPAMGTEWEALERAIEEINQYPLKSVSFKAEMQSPASTKNSKQASAMSSWQNW
ncbi:MAG: hypothetical protein Q6L60_13620 [Thermostichus sp. HHBFW_bins_43]